MNRDRSGDEMRFSNEPQKNIFIIAAAVASLSLAGCFDSSGMKSKDAASESSTTESRNRVITVQKSQGINVGESNSIWTVGMLKNTANDLTLAVDRISLTQGENYRKLSWNLPMTGLQGGSTSGTRTFLSEWGFLIGRGSNSGAGDINMWVVDHIANKYTKVFDSSIDPTGSAPAAGSRGSVFSYKVRGSDGKDYNFIAISYKEAGGNIRIERFLVDTGNSNIETRFKRVTPYSSPSGTLASTAAVYSSFLYPNCGTNGCTPIFYGNFINTVQGYDLTADVPPTPYTGAMIAAPLRTAPNAAFTSVSHAAGQPFGAVNVDVYSMAGDPNDGYVFLASDQSNLVNNSHVAYDKTNEIVFRIGRESRIGPAGINDLNNSQAIVTAWKRECFVTEPNCSPITTNKSRVYSDVGENIGPSSDLGNGCVAMVGWKRTSEPDANNYRPGVYTACIRDPNNLDKGLAVTKVGEGRGATYMYNDFTGAYQADRPVTILFDLSDKKVTGMSEVKMLWVPKLGFSNNLTGLTVKYRCYAKAQSANPPAYKIWPTPGAIAPFLPGVPPEEVAPTQFPPALTMTKIPNCSGPTVNQVEFELTRIPKVRFTRFDSITLTGTPYP